MAETLAEQAKRIVMYCAQHNGTQSIGYVAATLDANRATAQSSLARKVLEAVEAECKDNNSILELSTGCYNAAIEDALAAIKRVCESEGVKADG